jgi:hypothetical protein
MDAVIEEICRNGGEAIGVAADAIDRRSVDEGTADCGGTERNRPTGRR